VTRGHDSVRIVKSSSICLSLSLFMPRIKENGLAISQPWHGFRVLFIEHVESMPRDDISQEHSAFLNIVHCIKRLAIFPLPAGKSLTIVWLVTSRLGTGKSLIFFNSVGLGHSRYILLRMDSFSFLSLFCKY